MPCAKNLKHSCCGAIAECSEYPGWTECVTQMSYSKIKKNLGTLFNIIIRKVEYFGHIMRNKKYEFVKAHNRRKNLRQKLGCSQISLLKNRRQWFNVSTTSLFKKAMDKMQIALKIADTRREHGT